jgi:hypothetical protein
VKALSIKQPWAELIVSGKKDIENRNWSTKLRENILIHASKSFDKDGLKWVQDNMGLLLDKTEKDFDKGGFVGIVKISDCVSESKSKWFFGEYGFVLTNPRRVEFREYKGQLYFFNVKGVTYK